MLEKNWNLWNISNNLNFANFLISVSFSYDLPENNHFSIFQAIKIKCVENQKSTNIMLSRLLQRFQNCLWFELAWTVFGLYYFLGEEITFYSRSYKQEKW